ncbi:hypothetical protein BLNAU_16923 [Blattamonas nauphoetae]|uniref:Uncharacterized protein n=1 Tax=Blattamonas nauphoetae TaxID=2049346 RepID=A0ABQ9XA30_9EUKA|nr:hypothetical protein BLNAU_16923 [Blattamonas nauphoetae]
MSFFQNHQHSRSILTSTPQNWKETTIDPIHFTIRISGTYLVAFHNTPRVGSNTPTSSSFESTSHSRPDSTSSHLCQSCLTVFLSLIQSTHLFIPDSAISPSFPSITLLLFAVLFCPYKFFTDLASSSDLQFHFFSLGFRPSPLLIAIISTSTSHTVRHVADLARHDFTSLSSFLSI